MARGVSGYTHLWSKHYVKEVEWFDRFNKSKLLQSLVDMKTEICKERAKREGAEKVETKECKALGKWDRCPDPGLWMGSWGTLEERLHTSEKSEDFLLILSLFVLFIFGTKTHGLPQYKSILKTQPWEYDYF